MSSLIVGIQGHRVLFKERGRLRFEDECATMLDIPAVRGMLVQVGTLLFPDWYMKKFIGPAIRRQRRLQLECQKCGACCSFRKGGTCIAVEVDPLEVGGLELLHSGATMIHNNRPILAFTADEAAGMASCPFFTGTTGEQCACSIYDVRPGVCRVFVPGDSRCLKMRDSFFSKAEVDPRSPLEREMFEAIRTCWQ